jgi:hypothetical protein
MLAGGHVQMPSTQVPVVPLQSPVVMQCFPDGHPGQSPPPQSTSLSSQSRTWSLQCAG